MTKYIVSYSGGLGSFMAAYILHQQKKDFELVFCETNSEDIDLYRFLNETCKYFNKELIKIDYGYNIWQAQHMAFYQANSRVDPCSRLLKRQAFKKWMKKNHIKPDQPKPILVLGIGPEEAHRTNGFEKNYAPFDVEFPLIEGKTKKLDIEYALDDCGIEPPRLYEKGFPHNNCGGFCVKAGQKQALMLLKNFPENYKWHEEKQEALFILMGQRKPTIRKTTDGEMQYLSLKEFREMVEEGTEQVEMFDEGLCACF